LVGVATSPEVNNSLTLKTVQTKFEIPAPKHVRLGNRYIEQAREETGK